MRSNRWRLVLIGLAWWLSAGPASAVAAHGSENLVSEGASEQAMLITDRVRGVRYQVEVSVPDAPRPPGGYPVLFVLDGNARFALLREARDTLTYKGAEGSGLPLVIVGVGYPEVARFDRERRWRDFTPALRGAGAGSRGGGATAAGDDGLGNDATGSGEARDFLRFLTRQLAPWVEHRFATNVQRQGLLGHSLGGLFTLYVQQRCPDCFDSLFAISPSLWWEDGLMSQRLTGQLDDERWCDALAGRTLMIGVGEHEQTAASKGHPQRAVLRRERAMVDRARDYQARVGGACTGLDAEFVLFRGEDHGSVMWPAARLVIEKLSQRYRAVHDPAVVSGSHQN